jgi:anti-sigma B factor antagonist
MLFACEPLARTPFHPGLKAGASWSFPGDNLRHGYGEEVGAFDVDAGGASDVEEGVTGIGDVTRGAHAHAGTTLGSPAGLLIRSAPDHTSLGSYPTWVVFTPSILPMTGWKVIESGLIHCALARQRSRQGGDTNMSVSTEWREGEAIVRPAGEVDLATAATVQAAILDAVARPDATIVIVDLTDVGFCDSSGISVLLRGRRAADDRGIGYHVTGANEMIRNILELTGVWPLLSTQTG